MMSYAFKRRSFLGLLGGAFGLRALLQNIEAHAQGMPPARRLLVMHHPVGTYRAAWLCQGSGTSYTLSRLLQPFAELKSQMIVLDGLSIAQQGPGGGHEKGTVVMMTGAPTRYTRAGQPETDDAAADGPSIDQLLLAKSAELKSPAIDSLQVSCDDRIDAEELSTRRLSYSTNRVPVSGVQGNGQQNEPITPELSPLALYNRVFGEMMPGGATDEQAARILTSKKSVLDFSLRELERLRTLAPASASSMIDAHAQAIRAAEDELVIDTPDGCVVPTPPADIKGQEDDGEFKGPADYNNPRTSTADHELHAQLGKAHLAVIKAAFACDLTRVVTFQFSPGTNHVSFGGMYPDDAAAILMHHPVSHRVSAQTLEGTSPTPTNADLEFLCRVETWYNQRVAEFLTELQGTTDVYGGNLLDQTVVPYVTEVANAVHHHDPVPTVVFGGKGLGFKPDQFVTGKRPHNDLWLTIAASLGVSLEQLQGEAILTGSHTGLITPIWAAPT
jgi:Protein of unknown function (DUF1552)